MSGREHPFDLVAEVYVSDTPPTGVNLPAIDGPNGPFRVVEETKTLRDEFALEAMKLLLPKHEWPEGILAFYSYKQADAMMEARNK